MVQTEEKERALNLGRKGHSFYLEGKAGTGKTITFKVLDPTTRLPNFMMIFQD